MKAVTSLLLLVISITFCSIIRADKMREECDALKKKIREGTSLQLYNILSIDGGGIRGLIPGYIIDQLETVAFDHAKYRGFTNSPEFQKCF